MIDNSFPQDPIIHKPTQPTSDVLSEFHGKPKTEIYVILSEDGSTILKDPGMDRPWSSPNRKFAEHHAKAIGGFAVDLMTAAMSIMRHPKNLPPGAKPNPF